MQGYVKHNKNRIEKRKLAVNIHISNLIFIFNQTFASTAHAFHIKDELASSFSGILDKNIAQSHQSKKGKAILCCGFTYHRQR